MFTSKLIPQNISDLKKTHSPHVMLPLEVQSPHIMLPLEVQSPHIMLPLEVVTYIMEFLPYSDRISAGNVCQLWYEASIDPKFLNHEKVVFINRMSLNETHHSSENNISLALKTIDKSCRPFLHFVFIELELSGKMMKFWTKVGPEIKSLSLQNCEVSERMFVEILSNCRSLEYLDVNDCREPFISGRLLDDRNDRDKLKKSLVNVTKLGLCQNRYLSDALFNRFVSIIINLREISLAGCQISFHPGLYKKFYTNKLVSHDTVYDSETVLTFLNIIQFIQCNSEKLHSLDFSQTLINSKSLSQIAELPKLCLKELYLQCCEQLTNTGVLSVTQYQCSLLVLDLSGCSRVTDQSLIYICNRLSQLKKLRVCNCRAITDLGVVELNKLPKIEFIDLSQCEQVSGDGIKKGLCSKENKQFKHLYLRALNEISSSTVMLLSENLTNLLRLDLSYCFNAVNDESVQAIFKNLIFLRSLKLANCEAITDAGLTGMKMGNASAGEVCLNFQEKSRVPKHYISLRSKAEESIVYDAKIKEAVKLMCENNVPGQESYSLVCLKGLQELDLQSCSRITDVSLEYAMKLKELQHLNLSRCQQITDVGLSFIASNNPSIDTLNLSHCHNISDDGVTALVVSLHRLKYIDLQGCKLLTNSSLMAIKTNCPSLRYLDISHCKMVRDAVDLSTLTALQTLHISNSVVY